MNMTVVSLSTLGNSVPTYLRDVLRNTLTDTQSPVRTAANWIFEGEPVNVRINSNLPQVFIDLDDERFERRSLSLNSPKMSQPFVDVKVTVQSSSGATSLGSQGDRDTISDQIINTLKASTSTDGTNTIASQGLIFKDITARNDDERLTISTPTGPDGVEMVSLSSSFLAVMSLKIRPCEAIVFVPSVEVEAFNVLIIWSDIVSLSPWLPSDVAPEELCTVTLTSTNGCDIFGLLRLRLLLSNLSSSRSMKTCGKLEFMRTFTGSPSKIQFAAVLTGLWVSVSVFLSTSLR